MRACLHRHKGTTSPAHPPQWSRCQRAMARTAIRCLTCLVRTARQSVQHASMLARKLCARRCPPFSGFLDSHSKGFGSLLQAQVSRPGRRQWGPTGSAAASLGPGRAAASLALLLPHWPYCCLSRAWLRCCLTGLTAASLGPGRAAASLALLLPHCCLTGAQLALLLPHFPVFLTVATALVDVNIFGDPDPSVVNGDPSVVNGDLV